MGIAALAATLMISGVAQTAQAQVKWDDHSGYLDFRGAVGGGGSLVGATVGPYRAGFSTVSQTAANSAAAFDIFCFDFKGAAGDGPIKVLTFAEAVAYAPLTTKFQASGAGTGMDVTKLKQVAWLSQQFNAGKTNWVNVHHAIWGLMWDVGTDGYGGVGLLPSLGSGGTVGSAQWWVNQSVAGANTINMNEYRVLAAVNSAGAFDPSRQTFLTRVVTPEPSSYVMMAMGLMGLGYAARRRRKLIA
jgi:hypothetical protein